MGSRTIWCWALVMMAAAVARTTVWATPASGFTTPVTYAARFDELDIKLHTIPADIWQMRLKTLGLSDVYVKFNHWAAPATTGWHTHPGASFVIITSGTVTQYDGDDPSCEPHYFSADPNSGYPNHFIDPGGGHVHVVRNESTTVEATATVVNLFPAGAMTRINADQPSTCSVQ